jgi:hypothetical protein
MSEISGRFCEISYKNYRCPLMTKILLKKIKNKKLILGTLCIWKGDSLVTILAINQAKFFTDFAFAIIIFDIQLEVSESSCMLG